jgi:hypothetical protein
MLSITEATPRILQTVTRDETENVKKMCQNFQDRSSLTDGNSQSTYESNKNKMQSAFKESG